jgi:multicomponent Na+:H+ antiporter subunit A
MLWSVLIPLIAGLAAPWLVPRFGRRAGWILATVPVVSSIPVLRSLPLRPGTEFLESTSWFPGLGIRLAFRLDGLSATFALMVVGIGALILIYAGGYFAGDRRLARLLSNLLVFLGAMLGLVLADDLITLFVFWELTSVCSFMLVGFNHHLPEARAAALKALVVTGAGGLALLAALVMMRVAGLELGLAPGDASTLSGLSGADLRLHPLYLPVLILVIVAAATKSAQVPFHFWLPSAMAAPTPVSAYLHSATMVKAGVYLLARCHPLLGGTEVWRWTVTSLGLVTMITAAAMALPQRDLKRILAYSTVTVLGILTMLLGIGSDLAIKTAVVFLLTHAQYKAALFMVAGNVDHETGTRNISSLGGLRRLMPWTAAAGLLAALSKAGAPPMFGFVGKELLYKTKLDLETVGAWLVLAAVLVNVALVATALMVSVRPFWGPYRSTPKTPHEAPFSMIVGPIVLALAGLGVLFPQLFEIALGSGAASAIAGRPVVMELKLWHGLNTDALRVLALSLVTLGAGSLLYLGVRRRLSSASSAVLDRIARVGPERLFERSMNALPRFADRLTRLVQTGVLRHYLLVTGGVAVAATLPPLVRWAARSGSLPLETVDFFDLVLAALLVCSALLALMLRSRLASVAALGVTGLAMALIFALYSAPDLAMTQVMVETLSVIVLVLVFARLPRMVRRSGAAQRARDLVVAGTLGLTMALLVLASAGVNLESNTSDFYLEASVPLAKGRNVVNVILVDFRALDTLGEITVVAVAAFGVAALIGWRFGRVRRRR